MGLLGLGYDVVDGDGHIILDDDWWRPYLPEKYHDWTPRAVTNAAGEEEVWAEGRPMQDPFGKPTDYGAGTRALGQTPLSLSGGDPNKAKLSHALKVGGADPKDRLTAMDQDGVDVAYLFPSRVLSMMPAFYSSAFADAMVRAYNDWLHDYCSVDPRRLRPVAMLPQQDLILCVEELERVAKKGFRSVMLRPNTVGHLNLDHPNFDRLYAAAQDLDVAVCIHEGFSLRLDRVGIDRLTTGLQGHVTSHPFEHMMACLLMITGGVPARFPKLRIGFMESGAGWAPFWLERMDEHWEKPNFRPAHPQLTERPSDIFRRQCWLGVEPDYHFIPHMIDFGLQDALVYSSDFPHFDCIFPGSAAAAAHREDISEENKRKLLNENALRFFNDPA